MITLTVTDDMNFPHAILAGCETALVVFAAHFRGVQDAYWIAEAGLTATCVDMDRQKLEDMEPMYPSDWEFVEADAYEWAVQPGRQWDVVTLDPWSGQFQRCADNISAWCRLARHAVVLGTGLSTDVEAPTGWTVTDRRRRSDYDGGVFWTVLERV